MEKMMKGDTNVIGGSAHSPPPPEQVVSVDHDPDVVLGPSSLFAPPPSSSSTTRRQHNNFANRKNQCLGKRDKSSAGRLDPGAVDVCACLNAWDEYYTTSSCAGRCFLYRGMGVKATDTFERFRVSHDGIKDAERYFRLTTLDRDPTGGGDPIKEFDGGRRVRQQQQQRLEEDEPEESHEVTTDVTPTEEKPDNGSNNSNSSSSIWLRYEPFILHVACRSLAAASQLLATARPTFKNVGLTAWKNDTVDGKYLVAIWGDEGLDMPLTNERGDSMITATGGFSAEWLATLVNERHERNAAKIARLVQAVRSMPPIVPDDDYADDDNQHSNNVKIPRSYDVIGDVALIYSLSTTNPSEQEQIGNAILQKNKAIKVVALRESQLSGTERAPDSIRILAGTPRSPLMTTHREYGVAAVVDLHHTFFSPRMGPERLRICQQTARGEHVLVLFAGVCLDALQLAARAEAASVTAVEWNETAVRCARRSHQLLAKNRQGVKCPGAAERLEIVQGDCLEVLPTLPRNHYSRILAPRPKEGSLDGNQPESVDGDDTAAGGAEFLAALLPVLKADGGECHWYDFAADHEFPKCKRTVKLLSRVCVEQGLAMEVLHVANAGSVAMRQLRVCVDFRVSPLA